MRDTPIISVAPAVPINWSKPVADDSRPGNTKTDAGQHGHAAHDTREPPLAPSLSAQAFDVLLAAELDDLWRRQQRGLNQPSSHSRRYGARQDSEVWRNQLLAEIEELAGELKRKVVHFGLFCALQSADEASVQVNAAAVAWMQDALEDIAATAMGMEMGSREALLEASQTDSLRASEAVKQDLILDRDHDRK
jgi:hypothetical protein